ncbi:MAG: SH3 domain-containing protein [Anaerolineae bacterium]|nr:SH3 domain-containing protein [Anaerolineae bacterium]
MKLRTLLIVFALALCVGVMPAAADDPPISPFVATAYRTVNVFTGPGITYLQLGSIRAGIPLTIVERNSVGTWVHVQRARDDGTLIDDGWIISGYLNFDIALHFSDVPVSPLPDADADSDMSQLHDLYLVPVIPTISDAMREVYRRGRDELRNYSHVVTKVGDSITADDLYLAPLSRNNNVLGPYDYLGDAMLYFGASTTVPSVAAQVGMTTYTLFDAGWAPDDLCEPRETPLDCEYRRKRPSASFIMFGPNDLLRMDDQHFDEQMRKVVQTTLDHGIIPVLSTFSYDPGMGLWLQSVNFNRRLVGIAADYQVPIINLWLAARPLPEYGLEIDHIHMKHWGAYSLNLTRGSPAFSGAALRNLLTLRMLDEIRRTVILDPNAVG